MPKAINIVGKKFGKLFVVCLSRKKYKRPSGGKSRMWTVRCDCGLKYDLTTNSLKHTQQCRKCANKEFSIRWKRRLLNNCKIEDIVDEKVLLVRKIKSLNLGAEQRRLSFNVDLEFLWDLYECQKRKCAITGAPILFSSDLGKTTASLDRVDSKKGYEQDNVKWVHKNINRMKMGFDEKYFIEMCKRVSVYNL
jgi:hypothetical protein